MNLFTNPQYNGKFMGANSAKPIAGVCTSNAYRRNLIQAKVSSASGDVVVGAAVFVSNDVTGDTTSQNAQKGLLPTTLICELASAKAGNGFAVMSPNAVLEDGDNFPKYVSNQVIGVALIGSGAELYLPCDETLVGGTDAVYWDGSKLVRAATAPTGDAVIALSNILILSGVVDGVVGSQDADTNAVSGIDSPVVKVRI